MWGILGIICVLIIGGFAAEIIPSLMGDMVAEGNATKRPAFWIFVVMTVGMCAFIALVLTGSIAF